MEVLCSGPRGEDSTGGHSSLATRWELTEGCMLRPCAGEASGVVAIGPAVRTRKGAVWPCGAGELLPRGSRVASSPARESSWSHGCSPVRAKGWQGLSSARPPSAPYPCPRGAGRVIRVRFDGQSVKTLLLFSFWLNQLWFCPAPCTGRASCFPFCAISILLLPLPSAHLSLLLLLLVPELPAKPPAASLPPGLAARHGDSSREGCGLFPRRDSVHSNPPASTPSETRGQTREVSQMPALLHYSYRSAGPRGRV